MFVLNMFYRMVAVMPRVVSLMMSGSECSFLYAEKKCDHG
jgi:hypothetical protein